MNHRGILSWANSLIVKSTSNSNKWSLPSDFLGCESFLDSNSPDIVGLSKTNLEDSINSSKFSVRGHLL